MNQAEFDQMIAKMKATIDGADQAIEDDSNRLLDEASTVSPESVEDVLKGFEMAVGILGVSIMQGLSKIFNDVLSDDGCDLPLFNVYSDEELAHELGRLLTTILQNVIDERDGLHLYMITNQSQSMDESSSPTIH